MEIQGFKSLLEFQQHFDTNDKCRKYLEHLRWQGNPVCPYCSSEKIHRLKKNNRLKCGNRQCLRNFSALVGTVFENTKLPLTKWFVAMYLLTNHSKGISSLQLSKFLGITQKSAWFVVHRIRELLAEKEPVLLNGIVEVDECYVGGKFANIHASKRKKLEKFDNKTMVFGAVQREGNVVAKIIPDTTKESLISAIKENVEQGSIMVSDDNVGYKDISKDYKHVTVNHSAKEYVRGAAHTNTIEGFWSLLKRQIVGIHHFVSRKHLQRYVTESAYRYNRNVLPQDGRFAEALINCSGRLTYNELIKP